MTSDELIRAQRRLGLSNVALARLCGRDKSTVGAWRAGSAPVPMFVETILFGAFVTSSGTVIRDAQSGN